MPLFSDWGGVNAETVTKYSLGQKLTLEQIKDGQTPFAIVRSSDQQLLVYGSTGGNTPVMKSVDDASLNNLAPLFKCEAIALNNEYCEKLDEARNAGENAFDGDASNASLFMFHVYKADMTEFSAWPSGSYYVSHCGWTANSNILNLADNKFGNDIYYNAIWKVEEVDDGYTFQSQSLNNKKYLVGNGAPGDNPVVWKFYELTSYTETYPDRGTYNATDAKVLMDAGVHTSNIEFTWENGLNLSDYQYLVITLGQCSNESYKAGKVTLVSKNNTDGEVTVQGDDYGDDGANMWFGPWNHHYTCPIDLEKLRLEKKFDIHNVYKLSIGISGSVIVNNIYATNEEPKTIKRGGKPEEEGSYRNVTAGLTAGTYGTVCLPYQASYAGVTVYEIKGKTTGTLELTPITGLMEAGKAYFYQVNTPLNPVPDPEHPEKNVVPRAYFYKANTAADVADPVASNGLVGTFTDIKAPNDSYVLSGNKLYFVNSDVAVAANHAYINMDEVSDVPSSEVKGISIAFDDDMATAITEADDQIQVKAIYSVNGTLQRGMQKGVNIVKMSDGSVKKVMVK